MSAFINFGLLDWIGLDGRSYCYIVQYGLMKLVQGSRLLQMRAAWTNTVAPCNKWDNEMNQL